MTFRLINAGATFQKMIDTIFKTQIGRNIQVYVDDIIISKAAHIHVTDLQETFKNIRLHSMRLNPAKCSFGLTSGKFLGFLVSQRGIKADPSQIKEIIEIPDPSNVKKIQKLTGCIAALRRFIPQVSKKCLPFFQVIKKSAKAKKIVWDEECKLIFSALK